MKMVTTLAGQQLQKDTARRKLATMSSIREDPEADAGESKNPLLCVILHEAMLYFAHQAERSFNLTSLVSYVL